MTDLPNTDIDPETGWSRSVIRLMARAISKARSGKPTSWLLYRDGEDVVLHVGKRNACVMNPHYIELFVNVNSVDRMKLQSLGVATKEMENRWFPGDGKMRFPVDKAEEVVALVEVNHLNAIGDISRIAAATTKRVLHDECLRLKLNEVGGVNITSPGYSGYRSLRQLNCE